LPPVSVVPPISPHAIAWSWIEISLPVV